MTYTTRRLVWIYMPILLAGVWFLGGAGVIAAIILAVLIEPSARP